MGFRRIVAFLMGAWIGGSALLIFGVYQNFNAIDEILKNPPDAVQKDVDMLGAERVRVLLRYSAGIENVDTFSTWEEVQIGIGLLATVLLFLEKSTRVLATLPLAMTLLVLFLHFRISPDIAWSHRLFAFAPWAAESHGRDEFWRLHAIYEGVELREMPVRNRADTNSFPRSEYALSAQKAAPGGDRDGAGNGSEGRVEIGR